MFHPSLTSAVILLTVAHLVTLTVCQQSSGCNIVHQFTQVGVSALLQSPGYPNSYGNNLDCRYSLTSPPGTQMTISCADFNVESSSNCEYDVLYISPSGDPQFRDQQFFCGQGTFSRTSTANALTMGFHTDDENPGSALPYRFQCQITVKNAGPSGGVSSCNCGQQFYAGTRIVGGTDASIGEFPWRVSLYSTKLGVFCGGTIISRNYVLTAAHCTNSVEPGDTIYVNAGDFDLSNSKETPSQLVPVDYVIQNSLYNDQTQDSDIALLKLQSPLNFSNTVSPVCLPWKFTTPDYFNGQMVTASGWGTQYFGGGISPTLKKVELPVLGTKSCADFYRGSAITVTDNMICTYAPGRDTCQGDSGGSIDYRDPNNGRMYSIGVVSQGISCGQLNQPGTYTKLTNYLNWIQGNTGETFCKA